MNRSTACLLVASALGAPAWVVDVKILPIESQLLWLAVLLGAVLLAGFFWARDGK